MLTLRGSASLLASADSLDGLARIASAIGFSAEPSRVDDALRDALALPPQTLEASIIPGHGSLRALLLTVRRATPVRDLLIRIASRLAARTPQTLWLVVVGDGDFVAVAAPTSGTRQARVAALLVSRARVVDSDAETVRMLAASRAADDLATHARFVEVLGREAISRRFFTTLERCIRGLSESSTQGSPAARNEVALLYVSRLLFLGFLEAKGWLDGDPAFLARAFDTCMSAGGGFHQRVLLPLFFGTLNTPTSRRARRAQVFGRVPFLNGGLFTRTSRERGPKPIRFSDDSLGHFVGKLLCRYRFTSSEETSSFEEAAIDPEMLGRTFECLMAGPARRASGVFYTPHELVERVTSCGLEEFLAQRVGNATAAAAARGDSLDVRSRSDVARALRDARVLDPSCGSGAFLVHCLDRLTTLLRDNGDVRLPQIIRREILTTSLFGVDVNPTAVWLCQLRLWLSIVIDTADSAAIPPLPNLDRNVRVGDSLAGEDFGGTSVPGSGALRTLRERYSRATGRRKASLARLLDRRERQLLVATTHTQLDSVSSSRRDLVIARRGRDLFGGRYTPARDELRQAELLKDRSIELRALLRGVRAGEGLPFSFRAHFADVGARGGFNLIIGNPPWVRPHRLDVGTREALRRRFTLARAPVWSGGATTGGAARGFAAQVDLAALFVERSFRLLAPNGALSLLLPAKLWRSLSGAGLRRFVTSEGFLARVEDYSDVPATFDAAVYPGLLVVSQPKSGTPEASARCTQALVVQRGRMPTTWKAAPRSLAWDESYGAPWVLLPPDVRRSFELLREAGVPLSASSFGRPLLGTKCGLNEAFVVTATAVAGDRARVVSSNGREGILPTPFLRPVARGEDVSPWLPPADERRLVWPYGSDGEPLRTLPPELAAWLGPFRRALLGRSDAKSTQQWWSLFRTDGAHNDVPRVIWADIGRSPRATVLSAGDRTIPLNSCYVARARTIDDALALACLLNSPLTAAWLSVIAEPARGGYRRYLGWTMSLLPIPGDWPTEKFALAELAHRAVAHEDVTKTELVDAAIEAFGVRRRDMEPLLAWAEP